MPCLIKALTRFAIKKTKRQKTTKSAKIKISRQKLNIQFKKQLVKTSKSNRIEQ